MLTSRAWWLLSLVLLVLAVGVVADKSVAPAARQKLRSALAQAAAGS